MGKEKIVYVGGFEMPDKNAAAHRVLNIGKILESTGKTVVYIGIIKSKSIDTEILSTYEKINEFDCFSVGYPTKYTEWIRYLSSAQKYIEVIEHIGDVSGVVFYNFPSIAMKNLMKYCRKYGIKCYADVTEWYSGKGRGVLWGIVKTFDTWYRMRILHKKMDGMIVISRYLETYYRKLPKMARIPVLADLCDSKWENHYEKSTDVLKLVYAGLPQKKDRIDFLIEALMEVKRPYHLDIVGITREQYLEMYPQHREWLETNNDVCFHGRVSHEAALDFIKRANYSCFVRSDNRVSQAGFPTKFVESVCCGTPVITNITSDLAEYMKNGENGVLLSHLSKTEIVMGIEKADFTKKLKTDFFDYRKYQDQINW